MTTYTELKHSSYLDFDSYRSTAPAPSGGTPVEHFTFNVALVLDRKNDPSALLNSDWASRQQQIDTLTKSDSMWSTYGADPQHYQKVLDDLASLGIQTVDQVDPNNGYVSSKESRTIWVQVNEDNFTTLFGPTATLMAGTDQSGDTIWFWQGNLSLPDGWASKLGVKGLWFDTGDFGSVLLDPGPDTGITLKQGPQGIGNATTSAGELYPNQIAEHYYDFPLTGALWDPTSPTAVATGTIGLVEPQIGSAVPSGSTFQELLAAYRQKAGISTPGTYTQVAPGGQEYSDGNGGERSLDVGVVTAVNPQSQMVLYAGSGTAADAGSEALTSYHAAIWDEVNDPQVISSSDRFVAAQPKPDSPFWWTAKEMFIDGALRNITVVSSVGDGGSGDLVGNGVTNVSVSRDSLYDLIVGGTSVAMLESAQADPTLVTTIVANALNGDPATLWELIAGGMTVLPSASTDWLTQTVWNQYYVDDTLIYPGIVGNNAGAGGVDPTQPVPWYQQAYGLKPTTSDPHALVGRGVPDVAALAGGDSVYVVPQATMEGLTTNGGTSASAPLWAALISQFDAIFADQKLPQLGYMNDLLYIASAIAPGSFDDVQRGHNTSSFYYGGPYTSRDNDVDYSVNPTGYGYHAGEDYDLVSGLGTPNGVLLGRALTAIAHAQKSYAANPAVLDFDMGAESGADQSLIFQTSSALGADVTLLIGGHSSNFTSAASGSYAWTTRLAQQALQPEFDAALVTLFDGQAQGTTLQASLDAGTALSVLIDTIDSGTPQGTLTTDFGFVDFKAVGVDVRAARPVAVAETVDQSNDQTAIVRLRQNGTDDLKVTFFRVDDLTGTINGIDPGQSGYAAAAATRAYQTTSGGTAIEGPGYGNHKQTALANVDSGDLVAMKLDNLTTHDTYWAFAQANEKVDGQPVNHLWSYGLNTWGWEDRRDGGDRDYNDLIVGIDFTSAYGHGWLTG